MGLFDSLKNQAREAVRDAVQGMADSNTRNAAYWFRSAMENQPEAMEAYLGEEDYAKAQRLYSSLQGELTAGADQAAEDLQRLLEAHPEDKVLAFVDGDQALQTGDSLAVRMQEVLDENDERVCSIGVAYGKWKNNLSFQPDEENSVWDSEALSSWLGDYVTPGSDLMLTLDGEDCPFDEGDDDLLKDSEANVTDVAQKLLILDASNKVSTATPEEADAAAE